MSMKKVLLLLAISLFCCSCEPYVVKESRKIYKAYFEYALLDPSSLKIHSAKCVTDGSVSVKWEINYSADNGSGGKMRRTVKIETLKDIDFYTVNGQTRPLKELEPYLR